MSFGERLKELRTAKDLNQRELGEIIDVTRVSVSAYENGYSQPSLEVVIKLADLFKVTIDYLICREHEKMSNEQWEIRAIKAEEELRRAESLMLLINRDIGKFINRRS